MQEVKRILGERRAGALATVEEGKPRVRPFQFQFEDGGKYYFCTANTKDVCRQLKQSPCVEFTAWAEDGTTVRLRGEVRFAGGKEIKERVLKDNDPVRSIYQSADNPVFEVFYLEHGQAIVADFSGRPPRRLTF